MFGSTSTKPIIHYRDVELIMSGFEVFGLLKVELILTP